MFPYIWKCLSINTYWESTELAAYQPSDT